MREILFRGKPLNKAFGNKFIFGSLGGIREGLVAIYDCLEFTEDIRHFVDPDTVGQYTGLTDKNGIRIFEGDILQFDYTGKNLGVNGIATVVFENGKFGVQWGWHKESVTLDGFANTTLTVIGNIHDNPELLARGG